MRKFFMKFFRRLKVLIFGRRASKINELLAEKSGAMERLISELEKGKRFSRTERFSENENEGNELKIGKTRPSSAKF